MTQEENNPDLDQWEEGDTLVETAEPELEQPGKYTVFLINDDFTPMDFVIEILQKFFGMSEDKATQIMLHVHTRGRGKCGTYTYEIAETKVQQVNEYSRQSQHPLMCAMEESG
ncbi:MAG: ATP-dependent Clp protease adapter ClpS [bacterium]